MGGAEFGNAPSDRFHRLEQARLPYWFALRVEYRIAVVVALHPTALADVEGDARGQALVQRVEIHVVGDEELARADDEGAGARHELGRTEVGRPSRIGTLGPPAFLPSLP